MKLAHIVRVAGFAVIGALSVCVGARADSGFESLHQRRFDRAIRAFDDSLRESRTAGDAAGAQRWTLMRLATQLASDERRDGERALGAIAAPEALVGTDWGSGLSLWALYLLARDEAIDVHSAAFKAFETACRGPGPLGTEAGSVLCGLGSAFEAAGCPEAGRRMFAAAAARCTEPSAAVARSVAMFNLTLLDSAPWGLVPLDRAQTDAMRTLEASAPRSFALAVARYAVDEAHSSTRIPLPKAIRTARLTKSLVPFESLRQSYFTVVGSQWCQPKGRFVLLPGCNVDDRSGLGTLLLPMGDDDSGHAPLDRAAAAGDLLARAELMRRGFHTGGVTIARSGQSVGTTTRSIGRALGGLRGLGVRSPLPTPDLPSLPSFPTELLGQLDEVSRIMDATPDSLLLSNPIVLSLLGKEATKVIDGTIGKELYTNPRIPYMDWGARELELGIGWGADVTPQRAWTVSEFWRAANIKKYAALSAIAHNDRTLSAAERALIRQQMTFWWEMIVSDQRTHLGERTLDDLTGGDAGRIAAELDTIALREAEFRRVHDRVQQISDTPALRRQREAFIEASLKRARSGEVDDLTALLPPGTVMVMISTNERNTSVITALVPEPGEKVEFAGHLLFGLGRRVLAERVGAFLETLRQIETPESAVLDQGGELFDALFSNSKVLGHLGRSRRIVFVPNGPAGDIPFNALAWNTDGTRQFLGLTRPISVDESVALIRYLDAAGADSTVADRLVSGAPVPHRFIDPFIRREVDPGRPLEGAKAEAKDLATLYGVSALVTSAADETTIRDRAVRSALIHIASHGYDPSGNETIRAPLAAGIWLSATCDTSYSCDGMLQAWEIVTQMNLNADLVVFSGCSTGRLWTESGTIGEIARSTLYAGARSVLVSQWDVSDQATAKFMTAFHQRLQAGAPRDQALLEAMSELHGDPATSQPSKWAAFRCLGIGWKPLGAASTVAGK